MLDECGPIAQCQFDSMTCLHSQALNILSLTHRLNILSFDIFWPSLGLAELHPELYPFHVGRVVL